MSLSLLLVEPARAQFQILQGRLAAVGITDARHARTGGAALELIAAKAPDLVMRAMHLPDMTGAALAQALRGDPETQDVLFALLSSERSLRFLEPIRQAGVLAILRKPLQREPLEALVASVRDILRAEALDFDGFLDEVRVLLVDDSRTARMFMRQVLESIGLEHLEEAADGAAAQQLLTDESFDLVVTDLHMPRIDGMALTRWIRTLAPRPDVPIIMVTSEQDPQRRAQAAASGVSALIEKPFAPKLVRELLGSLLGTA